MIKVEWIEKLNNAVDYIESKLDEEIDVKQAAKIAVCSEFHFQRMFTYIAGVTLGEYIRRRRMTLAAFDLMKPDAKVIDVAMKYGYDSPTSFCRAFRSVHGAAPSEARKKGISLSAFPRITFVLSIKGEEEMNYRIVNREGFRIVGVATREPMTMEDCFVKVPQFCQRVIAEGYIPRLCALADGSEPVGILGVSLCEGGEFSGYFMAVATEKSCPEGLEEYFVPTGTWAVFECCGAMPDAMKKLQQRIVSEWLPTSGYEYAPAPDIEVYFDGDKTKPDYHSQVWLPIIKATGHID